MESLRIRFVTCVDLVSALIRDKTFCAYSHVEFTPRDVLLSLCLVEA